MLPAQQLLLGAPIGTTAGAVLGAVDITTGISATPANLDANGGLFWPAEGIVLN